MVTRFFRFIGKSGHEPYIKFTSKFILDVLEAQLKANNDIRVYTYLCVTKSILHTVVPYVAHCYADRGVFIVMLKRDGMIWLLLGTLQRFGQPRGTSLFPLRSGKVIGHTARLASKNKCHVTYPSLLWLCVTSRSHIGASIR